MLAVPTRKKANSSAYTGIVIQSSTPACLIVGWARSEGVIRTIETLKLSGVERIFLALDGPISESQYKNQIEVIKVANDLCSGTNINLKIWHRTKHLGLATAVISAVDWFFENEDQGIILEDDLIFTKSFIDFSEKALNFYKDNTDVWLISGSNFFEGHQSNFRVKACSYPIIWGWATWHDRWEEIRSKIIRGIIYENFHSSSVKNFWITGHSRAMNGKIDSWAVPFAALQHSLGKLTVVPPKNLVTNVGNDLHAVHTNKNTWYMNRSFTEIDSESIFQEIFFEDKVRNYDMLLEKNIYKITKKNSYSKLYMVLFDWMRFPKSKRKPKLINRLGKIEIPS